MKIEDHITKIEQEVQAIARDGHLSKDIAMARFVNAIEYEIHEARQEVEHARQYDRDSDLESSD